MLMYLILVEKLNNIVTTKLNLLLYDFIFNFNFFMFIIIINLALIG